MIRWLTLLFLTGWNVAHGSTAKILGLMPIPAVSHHTWNRALLLELIAHGHQVTVLSPDPEKQPVTNHTDIVIEKTYDKIAESEYNYETMSTQTIFENSIIWFLWGQSACEFGMASKGAQKLMALKDKEIFDLIIIDLTLMECFLGFVPIFGNPPVIAVTAYASPSWYSTIVGNPQCFFSLTHIYCHLQII
jgi:hypothetical protein